jgi:hypothetical protein
LSATLTTFAGYDRRQGLHGVELYAYGGRVAAAATTLTIS